MPFKCFCTLRNFEINKIHCFCMHMESTNKRKRKFLCKKQKKIYLGIDRNHCLGKLLFIISTTSPRELGAMQMTPMLETSAVYYCLAVFWLSLSLPTTLVLNGRDLLPCDKYLDSVFLAFWKARLRGNVFQTICLLGL